jgi:adenylylsulfate kinase-like enzyme
LGEISNLFVEAGVVVRSFISPYQKRPEKILETVGTENFIENSCQRQFGRMRASRRQRLISKARAGNDKKHDWSYRSL